MSEIATTLSTLWPSQDEILELFDLLGCELGRVLEEEDHGLDDDDDDDAGVRRIGRLDDLLISIFDGIKKCVSGVWMMCGVDC